LNILHFSLEFSTLLYNLLINMRTLNTQSYNGLNRMTTSNFRFKFQILAQSYSRQSNNQIIIDQLIFQLWIFDFICHRMWTIQRLIQGGKNTHAHGYLWVKSVTGTGQVAKWVSMGIINGYLTTHYYMDGHRFDCIHTHGYPYQIIN